MAYQKKKFIQITVATQQSESCLVFPKKGSHPAKEFPQLCPISATSGTITLSSGATEIKDTHPKILHIIIETYVALLS